MIDLVMARQPSASTAHGGGAPDAAAADDGGGETSLSRPPAAAAPFRSVGFTLSTLGFAVAHGFRETLAPLGIEPRDFALLRAVGAGEGHSQQAIGERLGIPASRMVAFIDSLEERGLLERRRHPTDRRARALHLTDGGRALLADAYDAAVAFETALCRDLAPGERERLLELLGKVQGTLGLAPGVHAAHLLPDPGED
jgi:DNA-binding MarR family transcriptional regulator